ncbi:MAG TPA: MBOAT family protein [Nitrospirota bacterium]|nr:MBOAT family protein [Nitrospirota bacterium]
MLFNSFEYFSIFLPLTVIIYFLLNRWRYTRAATAWLVLASLVFYCWWNVKYLALILASILVNYGVGSSLGRSGKDRPDAGSRKYILLAGLLFNVLLLGYYKYTDFFIANINALAGLDLALQKIVLPLGISFFTFTQIAYLVDTYKGTAREYDFLNYGLFVTFFPHLLAGPIIHHKEMMPQFASMRNKVLDYRNVSLGLFLFFVGLFKKIIIADDLAPVANAGFAAASALTLVEAWVASLSYTLQLYFDFSAYTDMALGAALLFNIRLPINFDSPYKALDITDFWRRWHMTLSRFLRDYVYIPLGGNRQGTLRTYQNLMATFLVGGLWHGAGWTFVFWGFLHGVATAIHRLWSSLNLRMPRLLAWFITFNFVNVAWVFFRARSWPDALKVLKAMAGLNGVMLSSDVAGKFGFLRNYGVAFGQLFFKPIHHNVWILLVVLLIVSVSARNSNEMTRDFKPTWKTVLFAAATAIYAILNINRVTEFLYFNF